MHAPCHILCVLRPYKGVLNMLKQNDCQEDCILKQNYSSGDFFKQKIKELQPITMYFQWTLNETGHVATVQFQLSPLDNHDSTSYSLL